MAGIGETLREAREGANLDIVDFEARTKIRAKYLRALEEEEWALLPGYTFTKGFLRTYADMLGLDGRALVDEFKRQYRDPSELEAPPLTSSSRRDPRRGRDGGRPREQGGERGGRTRTPRRPGWPPIVIAVVVLAVLLAGALYAVGVLLPRKPGGTSTTHTSSTAGRTTRTTRSHTKASHGHTTKPKRVGVRFVATMPVYVCLVGYTTANQSHPRIRVNGLTLAPGQHEPTYHDNHFSVSIGNSSVVLFVNGRRHAIAASPNAIDLGIGLHGHVRRLPASQAPSCG